MSRSVEDMERLYQDMIRKLSPGRRVWMACDMFSTARTLAIAGLLANDPSLCGVALKRALLRRFYGRDLRPEFLERVSSKLGEP